MSAGGPDLDAMLAAHDEAALIALASKGLARRAERDLAAGKAEILSRDAAGARVAVDGETVFLDGRGPAEAQCGCPAAGVCRHVLTAVLALRAEGASSAHAAKDQASGSAAPTAPIASAQEELAALTPDALERFAGADWADALALAREEAAVRAEGASLMVRLAGHEDPVVFIAGAGLKGAVFKGPSGRRRRAVAAAAVVVRREAGLPAPAAIEPEAPPTVSAAFLDAAAAALESGAWGALAGAPELARDRFFDVAVSARAEAAPRLSSALRTLSAEAELAATQDVSFRPDRFLTMAARAYALIHALRAHPDDIALTGALRRDYAPVEPDEIHMLGATIWRTPAGARGLRAYGYAPELGRWIATGAARGAGADPTFEPLQAYYLSLWEACPIREAIGRILRPPEPRLSADGQAPLTGCGRAAILDAPPPFDARPLEGALHRDWAGARADLASRFGAGLRRSVAPAPLLLAPDRFGALRFDDLDQQFRLEAIDVCGAPLDLSLKAHEEATAHRIRAAAPRLKAVLAEAVLDGDTLSIAPIALIGDGENRLTVWNLGLDSPPPALTPRDRTRRRAERAEPARSHSLADAADPLRKLASEAIDLAVEAARGRSPSCANARRDAEALGLASLAASLEASLSEPKAALRLAYLAGEIQASACLR